MLGALLRSFRPSQWAKNVFVLAPLFLAQKLGDSQALNTALLAFFAFCMASSAVYLINDIRDREQDRQHPFKRHRPIASGTLPVGVAIVAAVALILAVAAVGLQIGLMFLGIALGYLVLNLLYTVWLKHVVILDVMIIAIGFVLRVAGGAAAIRVEISAWLFLCTIFVALFLAFSKRRHELVQLGDSPSAQREVLNDYSAPFLDQMINVVTASTVISYALYATSPATVIKIGTNSLVLTVPLVLVGIFRYLYLIYQRTDDHSPTEALMRDAPFMVNIVVWGLMVLWIVYGGGGNTSLLE
jgi:4-hydroxybenzoate polyprenyltransferase